MKRKGEWRGVWTSASSLVFTFILDSHHIDDTRMYGQIHSYTAGIEETNDDTGGAIAGVQ